MLTPHRGLTHIGNLAKKHLDIFDKRVAYKFAVLITGLIAVVVILSLIF